MLNKRNRLNHLSTHQIWGMRATKRTKKETPSRRRARQNHEGECQMKIELDDKAVRHLERLLDYCEYDEERDYEGSGRPRDHVYRHIRALRKMLEKATPYATIVMDEDLGEQVFPRGRHNQPARDAHGRNARVGGSLLPILPAQP
jgi:hypothetical protein